MRRKQGWVRRSPTTYTLFSIAPLFLIVIAVASSLGAVAALVVVMIWVYYSAQIFLLGAEFTWLYSHTHDSRRGQKRPGAAEAQAPIAGVLFRAKPDLVFHRARPRLFSRW